MQSVMTILAAVYYFILGAVCALVALGCAFLLVVVRLQPTPRPAVIETKASDRACCLGTSAPCPATPSLAAAMPADMFKPTLVTSAETCNAAC
jgi:hypothetical protein